MASCRVYLENQQGSDGEEDEDEGVGMELVGRWDPEEENIIFLEDEDLAAPGAGELQGAHPCEDLPGARELLTARHVAAFKRDGICVIESAFSPEHVREMETELEKLRETPECMQLTGQDQYGVRQDRIVWLSLLEFEDDEEEPAALQEGATKDVAAPEVCGGAARLLEGVAHHLSDHIGLPLLVPERCMAACYESGASFCAHRDNIQVQEARSRSGSREWINPREVTAIVYPNTRWTKGQGGELCAHLHCAEDDVTGSSASKKLLVEPKAGSIVFFRSRELLHEVLAAHARRFAITMWFLNADIPVQTEGA